MTIFLCSDEDLLLLGQASMGMRFARETKDILCNKKNTTKKSNLGKIQI